MLTVAEVLGLPEVAHGLPEVVAGAASLGRPVRWAHVLDIGEVADLLRGGELVLSTGVSMRGEPGAQVAFVEALAGQRAAALAVELGTVYEHALPAAMTLTADRHGLPVIAFRRRVRFVDITQAVHGRLLHEEIAVLRRSEAMQGAFDRVALHGGRVPDVLQELARVIGNPVVLEDAGRQLVDFATYRADEAVVLDAWRDVARRGPSAPGTLAADVTVRKAPWGRIVALQVYGELDELAGVAVRRAAVAVALTLLHRGEDEEGQARTRGRLLSDVASSRLTGAEAARRAAALGFAAGGWLLPLAAAWRRARPAARWGPLLPAVRQGLRPAGGDVLAGPDGETLLVVLAVGGREPPDAALDALARGLHAALARHGVEPDELALAVGAPAADWDALRAGLARARQAAGYAAVEPPRAWHDARRSGVGELLFALRTAPELAAFVDQQLGPLLDHDRRRGQELVRTLESYLDNGCRKAQAARELHLERQSIYHRLERIEALLGVDLADGETLLTLHLALRARRLLGAVARRG